MFCTYYVEVVLSCKEWNFSSAAGTMHREALGRQIKCLLLLLSYWGHLALFYYK